MTFSFPSEDFDQSGQLISPIESLKEVIKAQNHVEPTRLMAGSTIITLEMSEADVHSLIAAFMAGKLDEMQVQELNLRLTHETPKSDSPKSDSYEDDLAALDLSGIEFTEHRLSIEPITDDVRIAEDHAIPKDADAEEATADEDAEVPESKP